MYTKYLNYFLYFFTKDMELTRFVLNCYKFYYPTILGEYLCLQRENVFTYALACIGYMVSTYAHMVGSK